MLKPSVAALVGSIDEEASRYVARCSAQPPRLEIIQHIKDMLIVNIPSFPIRTHTHLTDAYLFSISWGNSMIIDHTGTREPGVNFLNGQKV